MHCIISYGSVEGTPLMMHLSATSIIVQPPFGTAVSQGGSEQDSVEHRVIVGVVGPWVFKPGMRTCSPVTMQGSASSIYHGQSIPS